MVEYYISSIAKYTYADDKFYKNGIPLLDENGDDINEILLDMDNFATPNEKIQKKIYKNTNYFTLPNEK